MASTCFEPIEVWKRLHSPEIESLGPAFRALRSDLYFLWWQALRSGAPSLAARAYLLRDLWRARATPPQRGVTFDLADVVFVVQYPKPAGLGTLKPVENEVRKRGARTQFWVLPGATEALRLLGQDAMEPSQQIVDLTGFSRRPTLGEFREARADSSALLDALALTGTTPRWLGSLATALFLRFHTLCRRLSEAVTWPQKMVFHNDFPTSVAAVSTAAPRSTIRLTLQHGIPSREQTPPLAPWYGVWGPYYETFFRTGDTETVSLGCPRFDTYADLRPTPIPTGPRNRILLLGQPVTPDLNPRVRHDVGELARSLLAARAGFRVTLRLHPSDSTGTQAFQRIQSLQIESPGARGLRDAVREADFVVATPTTGLVEAILLGTPACAFCPPTLDAQVARALPPVVPRATSPAEVIALAEEVNNNREEWITTRRQLLCETAIWHVGSAAQRVTDWLDRRS